MVFQYVKVKSNYSLTLSPLLITSIQQLSQSSSFPIPVSTNETLTLILIYHCWNFLHRMSGLYFLPTFEIPCLANTLIKCSVKKTVEVSPGCLWGLRNLLASCPVSNPPHTYCHFRKNWVTWTLLFKKKKSSQNFKPGERIASHGPLALNIPI